MTVEVAAAAPRPVVDGWFTTGTEPALLATRCTACGSVAFPPTARSCRDPRCGGVDLEVTPLSRRGRIWSYTDAQYQPPPPYIALRDPYEPFAIAAVELPEGLVVLGQVAAGLGIADLRVGAEVDLVVEVLYANDDGERTVWRWLPVVTTEPAG
jgi:uncharacterized OB-fold protein